MQTERTNKNNRKMDTDQTEHKVSKEKDGSVMSRALTVLLLLVRLPLYAPFELLEVKDAIVSVLRRLYLKFAGIILRRYLMIKLKASLKDVQTYDEYKQLGLVLDKLSLHEDWKANKVSTLYDYERIESRLENMRRLRRSKDIDALVHRLR